MKLLTLVLLVLLGLVMPSFSYATALALESAVLAVLAVWWGVRSFRQATA